PNPSCKAVNPEEAEVCQVCQSVLPHYYLWGVGDLLASLKPGTLLNQRYLLKRDRTFLDTKPGILPESLPEIPDFLLPYLHLSAYPLHVPRPYSVLRTPDQAYVLMLESSALWMANKAGAPQDQKNTAGVPTQLPRLINRWRDVPPLRQLNWLWQIAHLWDAFSAEQVAATLLDSSLLRVDGSILRLLELASPMPEPGGTPVEKMAQPTLVDLARSWQPLAESAHPSVRSFLERLCESLERQQLNAEQLTEQLSLAMTVCASEQQVAYDLSVNTDQGPTRKRNEDACFPESGTVAKLFSKQTKSQPQLLIVCDGIGGHQGGDVASKLAISTIREQLKPVLSPGGAQMTATELSLAIEAAICAANDEISAQNDRAQRQARDRMGTTLVLALVKGSEVYIAHLGDSRAYRVSGRNCQQVTLDDDVASRQVRLGGSLYREVLVQPGSGSLIQALGMGPSQSLRPTVQRFVIDESCVFLLCSDGLSDSDRVEQFWQRELKPLVSAESDTAKIGLRLVDIANRYNGHDNVTAGLLNAQVVRVSERIVPRDIVASMGGESNAATRAQPAAGAKSTAFSGGKGRPATTLKSPDTRVAAREPASGADSDDNNARKTELRPAQTARLNQKGNGRLKKAGIALVLILLAAGVLYSLLPGLRDRFQSPTANPPTGPNSESTDQPAQPSRASAERSPAEIVVNNYVRIRSYDDFGIRGEAVDGEPSEPKTAPKLYSTLELARTRGSRETTGTIVTGGIVKVLKMAVPNDEPNNSPEDQRWVEVQLCSLPGITLSTAPVEEGVSEQESEDNGSELGLEAPPLNQPGETEAGPQVQEMKEGQTGWILESELAAISENMSEVADSQQGRCEG
ncbi:MAG: protein phosphatase 2C domain-containing protein, partial [Cyanobacteria bacterium J06632_3]